MFKQVKQSAWFKWATNKYILTGATFVIWMAFFDANSLVILNELDAEIDKLNQSILFYTQELEVDRVALEELESNPEAFEKYARENFWMHKPGEEVYIFEQAKD